MAMIDWTTGSWRRRTGGAPDAHILVAGDWAPIWRYERPVLSSPAAVYGDLLDTLRDNDLRIVNLEAPLARCGRPTTKDGPNLRGSPRSIAALKAVPFDVACLANNHVFDYGPAAFGATVRLLDRSGIRRVGAGLSAAEAFAPAVVRAGAAKVGLVNFCEGEDDTGAAEGPGTFGWDIELVIETVRLLRRHADLVIVIAHAGREYIPVPPPYIVRAYRRIAKSGADAVVAHHPHVPQGLEIHRGVPIAYSIGNFVFNYAGGSAFEKLGCLVRLGVAGRRLADLRLIPYRLGPGRLEPLDDRGRAWLFGRLRTVSELLADPAAVRAVWAAFIDRAIEKHLLTNLRRCLTIAAGSAGGTAHAAAMVRNRFSTPAHRELWIDAMRRVCRGEAGTAPRWARALVDEWRDLSQKS